MPETGGESNPELYQEMLVAHANEEEATGCLDVFLKEFAQLRKDYGIANVTMMAQVVYPGGERSAIYNLGDKLKIAPFALTIIQEEFRTLTAIARVYRGMMEEREAASPPEPTEGPADKPETPEEDPSADD